MISLTFICLLLQQIFLLTYVPFNPSYLFPFIKWHIPLKVFEVNKSFCDIDIQKSLRITFAKCYLSDPLKCDCQAIGNAD